jgi:hypothetical protein
MLHLRFLLASLLCVPPLRAALTLESSWRPRMEVLVRCGSWAAALSLLEEVAGGGRRGQRRRLQRGDRGLLARKAGRLGGRGGHPFSPTRPLRQVLHVGNQGLQRPMGGRAAAVVISPRSRKSQIPLLFLALDTPSRHRAAPLRTAYTIVLERRRVPPRL